MIGFSLDSVMIGCDVYRRLINEQNEEETEMADSKDSVDFYWDPV